MKYLVLSLFVFSAAASFAQIDLKKLKDKVTGDKLSTKDVASGLKEALTKGVSRGSDEVSKEGGYFKNPEIKIPFPPEVKQVESTLRKMGMDEQVDKFILSLNRAAEDAAKEAKPIFVSGIKQMTIEDAWSILKGEDDAATQYLNKTTSGQLKEKFKPIIKASLDKVNATKYYKELVTAYNKVPMVKKVNPDLDQYATDKATDGLFVMIAKEEKNIRENPGARTTDLLKKVFSNQK
jgi:predicted S18 family serine protease